MLKKTLITVPFLGVSALACAQHITLVHHYSVGQTLVYAEKTTYSSTVAGKLSTSNSDSTLTSKVTQVFDNGDAELSTLYEMKSEEPGSSANKPKPRVIRVNKWGMPVSDANGKASSISFSFGGLPGMENGIDVGQTIPYEMKGRSANFDLKGAITLVKVSGGIATFHIVGGTKLAGNAGEVHMDGTYQVDISTANITTSTSTTTGPGMNIVATMTLQGQ